MNTQRQLIKHQGLGLVFWAQWLLAQSISAGVLWICTWSESGNLDTTYRWVMICSALISIPVSATLGSYRRDFSSKQGCTRIILSGLLVIAILWMGLNYTGSIESINSSLIMRWFALSVALQLTFYIPVHHLARYYRQRLSRDTNAAIYGSGELAWMVSRKLQEKPESRFIGAICNQSCATKAPCPVLGPDDELRDTIQKYNIGRLYIALPLAEAQQIEGLYIDLLDSGIDVVWVPDIASLVLLNHSVTELDGLPVINLNESPLTRYPLAALAKSALDRIGALTGLLLLSPLLLTTALAVRLSSPGPVIFKQKRHGWNGQVIEVWKFRSMRMHDDKAVKQATRDDPRVTPVGKFIRRTSIDELPQLINVLQGHMSLVGPRPHAVAHNNYYSGKIDAYMARHRIKPGITGLAQISGFRGETETLDKMAKRVEFDLVYINSWSFWLDLKILVRTPLSLFGSSIY